MKIGASSICTVERFGDLYLLVVGRSGLVVTVDEAGLSHLPDETLIQRWLAEGYARIVDAADEVDADRAAVSA